MIFSIPNCPECGHPATATLERIPGWAILLPPDAKGNFEYEGETKVDWNWQDTVLDKNGLVTLSCDNDHEWKAMRGETSLEDACRTTKS